MTPEKLRERRRLRQQMAIMRANQWPVMSNAQMQQRFAQNQRIAEAQVQSTLDRILSPLHGLLGGI